jgi:hypothetical protein
MLLTHFHKGACRRLRLTLSFGARVNVLGTFANSCVAIAHLNNMNEISLKHLSKLDDTRKGARRAQDPDASARRVKSELNLVSV